MGYLSHLFSTRYSITNYAGNSFHLAGTTACWRLAFVRPLDNGVEIGKMVQARNQKVDQVINGKLRQDDSMSDALPDISTVPPQQRHIWKAAMAVPARAPGFL